MPKIQLSMKKILVSASFLILFFQSWSQIAGVSNDKLVVVNPGVIATRSFEFEPGFGYIWSTKAFDNGGNLSAIKPGGDSIQVLQALAFRFTYGFAKNFEIGTTITSDLNTFALGIKYTFLEREK